MHNAALRQSNDSRGNAREFHSTNHAQTFQLFLCLIFSHSLEAPTKFSKSGFLLRSIASILEQRTIEFHAIHASDLPPNEPATLRIANQFVADTIEQIETRFGYCDRDTRDEGEFTDAAYFTCLTSFPTRPLSRKPLLLFATGGLPGHVAILERALRQTFFRLGTKIVAARVHIGTGGWVIVGDDRPRLSRGAEREISRAIDLVLGVVKPKESKERSLQLSR